MKMLSRSILFILLITGLRLSAQDNFEVRLGSFKNGEVASVQDILNYPSITIINRNPSSSVKLVSYDCVIPVMDKKRNPNGTGICKNTTYALSPETIELLSKFLPGEDFQIKDITIEVLNKKTGLAETIKVEPIRVKIAAESGVAAKVDYAGKLMTGKDRNQPVRGQKVILQDQGDADLQTTITDNYGDFKFTELSADKSYKINVLVTDDAKIKDGQLYAAKPDGTIIRTFNKTKKGFVYELLPAELNVLAKEKEEDTELKIKKFGASKDASLMVIEDIYYESNSAEILPEALVKLDKIIHAMTENKTLKLAISSHTDSKGEDAYNMSLSEKRAQKVMEYFILQGIEKERLTAKGFGESKIRNRCKNGVDCSETEHQFNRRTEFNFSK
jgi:outer membrane protein OmpA-like peptidoglycan-associated protein